MSKTSATEHRASLEVSTEQDGSLRLVVAGHLDASTCSEPWSRGLDAIASCGVHPVLVDAAGLTYCDSVGASMLADFERQARVGGASFSLERVPGTFAPLLDLVRSGASEAGDIPPARIPGFAEDIGRKTVAFFSDLLTLITYLGEVISAMVWAMTHPLQVRWRDAFRNMQAAGVNAFPVVALVCFLLGLILSYQTASGFERYGAEVLMADMLGLSVTRELGPLMTAIVLTARSGSAFAAEIGTMKVNEEVDALTTMGLDPTRFLVTPKIIAAVVMTPILTVFANLMALMGGLPVWIGALDLSLTKYHQQLLDALAPMDIISGLIKAFVFGILVASVGCIRGLQTRGGAIAVGISTTSAVVSGIVLISVADMFFAVIYYHLGV